MQPSDAFKLRKAFFHALGKANTESTQEVFESAYKSLGNIRSTDVWTDLIPYCETQNDVDDFISNNPGIIEKEEKVTLTPVPGSNNQAWYYKDAGGKWIRPWISPVDIPNTATNLPSSGFQLQLFQENDSYIPPTVGIWMVDYYAGMIYFQEGYTPQDQGWGNVKATFYVYIGSTLSETLGTVLKKQETFMVDNTILNNYYVDLASEPVPSRHIIIALNGLVLEPNKDFSYTSPNRINFDNTEVELTLDDKILVLYYSES